MKISWGANNTSEVDSLGALTSVLDRLTAKTGGRGLIVEAIHDNGRTLAFGIGLSESILTFFDGSGGSYTSVGDREREDYVTFEFGGDVSEMTGAKAIPKSGTTILSERRAP